MSRKIFIFAIALSLGFTASVNLNASSSAATVNAVATAPAASSLWNGDIPSAEIIYSFFYKGSSRYAQPLTSHGYKLTDNVMTKQALKPGFCQMDFKFNDSGATLDIRLEDEAGRDWLVDNIKDYISSTLDPDYTVTLAEDGVIHFDWSVNI